MLAQPIDCRKATPNRRTIVHLTREQADIVVPGAWLTFLLILGFFARPLVIPGGVISTFVLGLYYAARDASNDVTGHD